MGLLGAKNQIGIYMDSEILSVLNAQSTSQKKAKVAGYTEIAEPNSPAVDVTEYQLLAGRMRGIFQQVNASAKTVSLAVPSDGSMIRHFELPILPKKEEKNAVRFEAQKYIPFDIKELYYDYNVYPDAARKKASVVFFGCKKAWVDSMSASLAVLDVKLDRVELFSQAITRSFYHTLPWPSASAEVLLVPVEEKRAELIFYKAGAVLMTRHLSFSRPAEGAAWDVPAFVSELRISLDYFEESFTGEKIAKIYLAVGQGESARPLCEAIQKEFTLPSEALSFPSILDDRPATPAALAAYGLTLGALYPQRGKQVNLQPAEVSTLSWEEEKKLIQRLIVKELAFVAAGLFGVHLLLSNAAGAEQGKLQKIVASYPKSKSATIDQPLSDLQIKEQELMQEIGFAGKLVTKRSFFTLKMNELVKTVPPNIRLTTLRFEGGISPSGEEDLTMRVEGIVTASDTGELTAVNRFMQQLQKNKEFMQGFSDIRTGPIRRVMMRGASATRFSLDCISTVRE